MKSQIKLLKKSKQVHSNWYREQYPDVALLGMDPAEHYLKYGADLGRNPGKGFDTKFYLETYPDVKESGINPLLHYVLYGQKEGRLRKPERDDVLRTARKQIDVIRDKLLSLGFTEQPLVELKEIVQGNSNPSARAMAAWELALWQMREKSEDGYRMALDYIATARETAPDLDFRSKLFVAELLCHHFLDQVAEGRAAYEYAARNGEVTPDVMLARANFQTTPVGRVAWINKVLKHYAIPAVRLLEGDDPPYDRLTPAGQLSAVTEGPLVTVLIAAYEAAEVLPTALRSLQEQTWKNLEIIVIDDCSPRPGTSAVAERFAASDPRIRLIRMEKNGGAYVARNRGLDEATGDYVTIHDADDWSHPLKIETQVRFMESHTEVMGCTTQQARATSELAFTRWTGLGHFIISNISSFLFRRGPMRAHLGYWDTVRFSADNELIRRMQAKWGKEAVHHLRTGPFSFQRDSQTSIVADDVLGINGKLFGARRQYLEAQQYHHANAPQLKYENDPARRPFPVPRAMVAAKSELQSSRHYPVIIGSDFGLFGGNLISNAQEIIAQKRVGIRTAIFPMYRYDVNTNMNRPILPEVWREVDHEMVDILSYGDRVTCDVLILRYPPILYRRTRFIPSIEARDIRVIVNQPPMSDYSENGTVRYRLADCAENVRHYFGKDATWHPIGPAVREALHRHHADELHHIDLSPVDWHNIIDIKGWNRGPRRRGPKEKLRIGRHSRDNWHKWPAVPEDIQAIYPENDDIEVHILGGARAPQDVLGYRPRNWIVHDFGAMHPRDFLAEIDIWVYFSHPDWVESSGRTIIEAMASGVPVILPETYKPLFGEAALYATPSTAVNTARRLYADLAAYEAQVEKARQYVNTHFSYNTHLKRLAASGVNVD